MHGLTSRNLLLALTVWAGILGMARLGTGDEPCCAICGRRVACRPVCHLKRQDRTVEFTLWGMTCEEFCVPGPSRIQDQRCVVYCQEDSDPKDPSVPPEKFRWLEWLPGCRASVHHRKKLMKKTLTRTVPSFEWVVEDLCPKCQQECQREEGSSPAGPPKQASSDKPAKK